jgi:hypothetical protein
VRCCQSCGEPFDGEAWQRRCWKCWREEREREQLAAVYDLEYRRGYAAGRRGSRGGLSDELIVRAVRLTHPDHHPVERFAEANAITARLLELRPRGRA